jgi:hypothetical protein
MKVMKPSRPTASHLHGLLRAESLSCIDVVAGIVMGFVTTVDRNRVYLSHPGANIFAWSGQTTV